MKSKTFEIPNISCGHCTHAIETELSDLAGVTTAKGNVDSRSVQVEYEEPATESAIRDVLKEINYPAK